jgi:hypothetical protein
MGGLRAVEDLPGVDAGLAIDFGDAAPVAHKPPATTYSRPSYIAGIA